MEVEATECGNSETIPVGKPASLALDQIDHHYFQNKTAAMESKSQSVSPCDRGDGRRVSGHFSSGTGKSRGLWPAAIPRLFLLSALRKKTIKTFSVVVEVLRPEMGYISRCLTVH